MGVEHGEASPERLPEQRRLALQHGARHRGPAAVADVGQRAHDPADDVAARRPLGPGMILDQAQLTALGP